MKLKTKRELVTGIIILLVIFGLFLIFQLVKKILGGSWTIEDLILGLLILYLGSIFTVGLLVTQLQSDHNHLIWRIPLIY